MHHIKNFKGFRDASIDLSQPLTVLIGPNGSGKSNLIEGIELLAFIAKGHPLHEISDIGRGGKLEIRGDLQACPTFGHESFTLGFSLESLMGYEISPRVMPEVRISSEKFEIGETFLFQTLDRAQSATSGDIEVRYNNFKRGGRKPQVAVSADRSVLSRYLKFAKDIKGFKEYSKIVSAITRYLKQSFVFDPVPKLMRSYERIGNTEMTRSGRNISAVLYGLSQSDEKTDKKRLDRLLERIRQLPDEPYRDLQFVTTQINDVIFGFTEGTNGHIVDARSLSDGTLRALAVLTALETVPKGSRLVIEEFDNGLHPSRMRILTEAIEDCCKRRKLNVLVTTHNPAALDALSEEQLDGVVLCAWDPTQKATNLVRLKDLPRSDQLLESGRLGDLVTRRVIERYLAPDFEERFQERAEKWLASLP